MPQPLPVDSWSQSEPREEKTSVDSQSRSNHIDFILKAMDPNRRDNLHFRTTFNIGCPAKEHPQQAETPRRRFHPRFFRELLKRLL